MANVADITNEIYLAAIGGTPDNPLGVPPNIASYLVGQAANETGNFTSSFFLLDNNCFGYSAVDGAYWQNGSSDGLADNGQPVASYSSVGNSTREIVDWIFRRGVTYQQLQSMSATDYSNFLYSNGYFTSSPFSYASNIERYIADFVAPIESVAGSLTPFEWVALGAAAYLLYKLL